LKLKHNRVMSIISVNETKPMTSGNTFSNVNGSYHIPHHLQEELWKLYQLRKWLSLHKSHMMMDSPNTYFSSGSSHSHSPFTFTNHTVLLTPHWNYFLNWE
jgi:hypothetical protein